MRPCRYIMLCAATAGALLLGGCADPQETDVQRAAGSEEPNDSSVAFKTAARNGTAPKSTRRPAPRIEVMGHGRLVVAEHGTSAEVAVKLSEQPDGDVVLSVSSTAVEEGAVRPETLRFTPENWYTWQRLRVQGVDDPYHDGDQPFRVRLAVDPAPTMDRTGFAGAPALEVAATNLDDERLRAEGSLADPLDITYLRPTYRGQVDGGESYYVVRKLESAYTYTVRLSDLSSDADLTVYADPAFSHLVCHSDARGTNAEHCVADRAEVLYIEVSGRYSGGGATYIMHVD